VALGGLVGAFLDQSEDADHPFAVASGTALSSTATRFQRSSTGRRSPP
jgi:hypothetical protein